MDSLIHLIILLGYSLCHITQTSQAASSDYYTAGVVEFHNSRASDAQTRVQENLEAYLQLIASEDAKPTDILVFPESTLNSHSIYTYVPDPKLELVAPCDDQTGTYNDFLVKLSCQARNVSKYLVINVSERAACDPLDPRPCASFNQFNTNVVFDRQGYVISRYRKVNLWGETGTNVTYQPDISYFDTDFGVRFGYMVCFDLLFYIPAQHMVDDLGITNFIVSAMWFSQIPFLTANQIQFAWSYGNDVTLLASQASNPEVGSSGSGIYIGREGWANIFVQTTGAGVRKVIVAKVPKNRPSVVQKMPSKRQKRAVIEPLQTVQNDAIYLKRDPVELYTSLLVNLTNGQHFKQRLCTNTNFCCDFELIWRNLYAPVNTHYYYYRVAVYDGPRSETAQSTNFLKNCAIFSCLTEQIEDCGKYFEGETNIDLTLIKPQIAFEHIEISALFPAANHRAIMPNTLTSNILPMPVNQFKWIQTEKSNGRHVRLMLNTTTEDLLTFSLYGNYYDNEVSAAGLMNGALMLTFMMYLNLIIFS